jgi:hypothetical protein
VYFGVIVHEKARNRTKDTGDHSMSSRVLSTEQAKVSIQRLQSIVSNELLQQLGRVGEEGRTLSDPNIWDGMQASRFRNDLWPPTKAALDRAVEALQQLQQSSQTINQNIMQAGGNG